ncbi:MAG: Crp/Fnr family transcriptional regulator [Spirochaetia bacterium]|nr:Crp/Fnr family transcriptional regulator [Spirochaetia bacterium]
MKSREKQLLKIFNSLNEDDQKAVVNFAGYLYEKNSENAEVAKEPQNIDRPDEESVIAAIKRLKKTYPMIEPMGILNQTSELLSAHLLKGRDKKSVIDELELLFQESYKALKNSKN